MKIICIGRNYIAHANELNNPLPTEPIFFLKPETALIRAGLPFFYPDFSSDIHYEVEFVVRICKLGKHIQEKFAHKYYKEFSVGIDFTARDLQENCKQKGLPWEISKAFDSSAPVGEFINKSEFSDINDIDFSLEINGNTVQKGNTGMMIFSVNKIISYVSSFLTLKIGDLIFTGTPAGVGPIKRNDNLSAYLQNRKLLEVNVR
ncbi:MAG: fumarylacetoacetate hydrolase family protein [Bacteroidetes bacterium]|nr:fumarylacetoacetate hydrolase family protein [Bacteroidota bacterium]